MARLKQSARSEFYLHQWIKTLTKPSFAYMPLNFGNKHCDMPAIIRFKRFPHLRARLTTYRRLKIMIFITPQRVILLRKRVDKIVIVIF